MGGILIHEPVVNGSKSSTLPMPNEVSSLDKGKGKAVLVDLTVCEDEHVSNRPILEGVPIDISDTIPTFPIITGHPSLPPQIFPSVSSPLPLSSSSLNDSHPLNPMSPILFEDNDSSLLFDNAMDHDGEDDTFLDLEDLTDSAISVQSSKKRKLEDGEEASSFSHE